MNDTFQKCQDKHQKAKQTKDKNPNKKGVASREETVGSKLNSRTVFILSAALQSGDRGSE